MIKVLIPNGRVASPQPWPGLKRRIPGSRGIRGEGIRVAVGVMLDSVVVRSFLVPALVALTGRFGMWPGHQRVRVAARRPPELSDASR